MDIIKTVCREWKLKLVDAKLLDKREFRRLVNRSTGRESDFYNKSYICGREITMGVYDDEDKRLAAFFHELGHLLVHKKYRRKRAPEQMKTLHWEIEAWNCGIFHAYKKFGIVFNENTIKWAYKQAMTYYKHA